ncbi:hypothetical protein [Aquabacterium sp.]|uniref:hypothetical protein n=1 Tax=Aquabacterium sp. TaxID=1872578 RepID=UPI0025B8206C|nr:hypothetical protein [Aquabacterium sp.]
MKLKFILTAILALACIQSFGQQDLPKATIAYFRADWCPALFQVERLNRITPNFYIKPGTCCIDRAILPPGVTLDYIKERFPVGYSSTEDTARCTGFRPDEAEADMLLSEAKSYEQLRQVRQQRAEAQAVRDAEQVALAAQRFETAIPTMHDADLCVAFGEDARGGERHSKALARELARRKFSVSKAEAAKGQFRIGGTICQMYAALGRPINTNRTVNATGEFSQHVYGTGFYIYTRNGRISSWQD